MMGLDHDGLVMPDTSGWKQELPAAQAPAIALGRPIETRRAAKLQTKKSHLAVASCLRKRGGLHKESGGVDGTRTRDPRRDRPVF